MTVQLKASNFGLAKNAAAAGCALLIGLAATPVFAAYPEAVKSACRRDFKEFCPKYDINSSQLRQCMRSVERQLGPRCVEALERSGERRR